MAKLVKESVDIREVTGFDTWDSQDAKTNQLRSDIQKSLVTLLDMEAVNSWDELKRYLGLCVNARLISAKTKAP